MCINPTLIKNNRGDYHPLYHRRYIKVPCGKCEECRENRQHEIMTRLSCHSYENWQNGGQYLFLTFTYNDAHLPHLYYNGQKQACFCWDDVLTLLKFLRKDFDTADWQYFGVCEYGKNTKRPHYHISFWISKNIDDIFFAETCRRYWTKQPIKYDKTKRTWQTTCNGFMFPSKSDVKLGKHLVRSKAGVSYYAAKYTCKDIGFYSIPLIKEIDENPSLRERFKRCLPHVFQSINLGYPYLSRVLDENNAATKFSNPLTGTECLVPKYAINKKSYNVYKGDELNGKGQRKAVRELNDFGYNRKCALLTSFIERKAEQYRTIQNPLLDELRKKCTDTDYKLALYHYVYAQTPFHALHIWYNHYLTETNAPFVSLESLLYNEDFIAYVYRHLNLDRLVLSKIPVTIENYIYFNSAKISYEEAQRTLTTFQLDEMLREHHVHQCQLTAILFGREFAECHDAIESDLFAKHKLDVLTRAVENDSAESLKYIVLGNRDEQIGTDDNITL